MDAKTEQDRLDDETLGDVPSWKKGADLPEGTRIHRYLILSLIGKGGMGAVYKAYDPELNRRIAIKVMTVVLEEGESTSKPQTRLMREAQALAKLNHPHVVSVFDVGAFEEGVYIAMEYVEGMTLRDWIRQNNPTQQEILNVMLAAGKGLQSAHRQGIVHRDFKPENLIVGNDGQVKVLDFGLARAADLEEAPIAKRQPSSQLESQSGNNTLNQPLTQFGALIGTTAYMAPEHFLHEDLDEKTDQFSYCVTLFEALYGERPFVGQTLEELQDNVTAGHVQVPAEMPVPAWIRTIIQRGLSVSKVDRYQSMATLLDDLADDPDLARRARRKRQLWVLVFLVVATMPFGLWLGLVNQNGLCQGGQEFAEEVWDQDRQEIVKKAFLGTQLAYAKQTWERVENRLNSYAGQWVQLYQRVCEATHIKGFQSERILDLKMGCLRNKLRKMNALIDVYGKKTDKTVLENAVKSSLGLGDLSFCDDEQALMAEIRPPEDPLVRTQVEALRDKLEAVSALRDVGKYRLGLVQARQLQNEVETFDYPPIQAEVLYQLGELLYSTGEYQNAEETLYQAARLAGETGAGLLAAKAMTRIVWLVGYSLARRDEGLSLGRAAEVIVGLGGQNEAVRARLYNNLGVVLSSQAEYQKALEPFKKALAISNKALGPDHPHVAMLLNNIGGMYQEQGEYEKSLEYHHKALAIKERALGSGHPHVAASLNNMGEVYARQGASQKALAHFQQSLAIWENALGGAHPYVATSLNNIGFVFQEQGHYQKALAHHRKSLGVWEGALGPDHPEVVRPLIGIGNALFSQGQSDEAVVSLQRALAVCEGTDCPPQPHAQSLFGLARALFASGKGNRRAIQLARQARKVFGTTPKAFAKEIQDIDRWLKNVR